MRNNIKIKKSTEALIFCNDSVYLMSSDGYPSYVLNDLNDALDHYDDRVEALEDQGCERCRDCGKGWIGNVSYYYKIEGQNGYLEQISQDDARQLVIQLYGEDRYYNSSAKKMVKKNGSAKVDYSSTSNPSNTMPESMKDNKKLQQNIQGVKKMHNTAKKKVNKSHTLSDEERDALINELSLHCPKEILSATLVDNVGDYMLNDLLTEYGSTFLDIYHIPTQKSTKKSKSVKKGWPKPSEAYNRLWDRFVPDSGKADTEIGEILRCASRVIYRFYNDGDIYGTDNGTTVQDELDYLARCNVPYIRDVAQEIINFCEQYVYDVAEEGEDPDDPDYMGPIYREFGGNEAEYDALMNTLADAIAEYCWTIERSEMADKSTKKSNNQLCASTVDMIDEIRSKKKPFKL